MKLSGIVRAVLSVSETLGVLAGVRSGENWSWLPVFSISSYLGASSGFLGSSPTVILSNEVIMGATAASLPPVSENYSPN